MFNELVQQVVDFGKQADNRFKKEAWTAVIEEIKQKTGKEVSLERCKNKVDIMKSYWRGFNWLRDQSGFGYNGETGLIEAAKHVWEAVIKVSNI